LQASELSEIQKALSLRKTKPKVFQETLEALPSSSPYYQIVVEELMKFFYQKQDWPSFFSYAEYYRKSWPFFERSDVYMLELLALLRHCQNDILFELIHEYRHKLKKIPPELDQMEALAKTKFKGKASKEKKNLALKERLSANSLWKTNSSLVGKVNPSQLQIRLENKCANF